MRGMNRALIFALPLLCLPLGGCLASMAVSAVGAAATAIDRSDDRVETTNLQPVATQACRERAAQVGSVHIIDTEQQRDGLVTVYGTVQEPTRRRSFECVYNRGRIATFTLREIRSQWAG